MRPNRVALAQPKPRPQDVQPPDRPPPEKPKEPEAPKVPAWASADDGVGVPGGISGGVRGGVPAEGATKRKQIAVSKPVFVQRQVMDKLKMSGEMPQYLPAAKLAKVEGVVIVKVCLRSDGTVDPEQTKILKGIETLNNEVLTKIRTWRYKPYTVDGEPAPACFTVKFVFRLE